MTGMINGFVLFSYLQKKCTHYDHNSALERLKHEISVLNLKKTKTKVLQNYVNITPNYMLESYNRSGRLICASNALLAESNTSCTLQA